MLPHPHLQIEVLVGLFVLVINNGLLINWGWANTDAGTITYPCSFISFNIVLFNCILATSGGGYPNFNWVNGIWAKDVTRTNFAFGSLNGGGCLRHWISIGI